MNAAYADPPYLGCGKRYKHLHPNAMMWDDPLSHARLAMDMDDQYQAWALSCSTPSLQTLLPLMPKHVRIAAWVKPFAVFRPGVGVAYTWEPVIFKEGRQRSRQQPTARDFVSANITLKKGLVGAKPPQFCFWLFDLLTLQPNDELTDLFPGTGIVKLSWDQWKKISLDTVPGKA
jgi:hypothetical protein